MTGTGLPKRVWRVAHSEHSPGWGGQEHRILTELRGFKARGSRMWMITPGATEIRRRASELGVEIVDLPSGKLQFPAAVMRVASFLHRARVEVLNPHSSRDSWICGLAGRFAKVPLILRTRHIDVPVPNRYLSRFVYAHLADHVVTTSPKITEHFQQLFHLPADRVSTIATGLDLERWVPEGPKADLGLPEDGLPRVGITAVLRFAKGHHVLLEAARILQDEGFRAHYLIAGDGPQRERLGERIAELGVGDCVRMLGHQEDIPAVLRALDLLVVPSIYESIPQSALQALAMRTPVIGSDIGGIPAVVIQGRTGRLFRPDDASALARCIREALTEREATRALAAEGRRFLESNHSTEHMLEAMEALYRRYLLRPESSTTSRPVL